MAAEPFPILLVEDSDDDLFLFKRLLAKAGIEDPVTVVTNGQAAIERLAGAIATGRPADAPRLLFLDLKLPLVSGFEVLEWIQTQPVLERMTVVILSSSAEARDVKRAYALGAHGYLVKYPAPAVFRAVIEAVNARADSCAGLELPGVVKP